MIRFGSSHTGHGFAAQVRERSATSPPAPADVRPVRPTPGEIVSGIGLTLSLHLAFAAAVVLALKLFGAD